MCVTDGWMDGSEWKHGKAGGWDAGCLALSGYTGWGFRMNLKCFLNKQEMFQNFCELSVLSNVRGHFTFVLYSWISVNSF